MSDNQDNQTVYNLSDSLISHVAKLIQMAILTGTDIVDNLRLARVVPGDDGLELEAEYLAHFEENIKNLVEEAQYFGDDTGDDG